MCAMDLSDQSSVAMVKANFPHKNVVGGFCRAGHFLAREADIRINVKGSRGCAQCYANKLEAGRQYRAETGRIRAEMKELYG